MGIRRRTYDDEGRLLAAIDEVEWGDLIDASVVLGRLPTR